MTARWCLRACISRWLNSTATGTTVERSTDSRRSVSSPRRTRDMSSRSSTRRAMYAVCRSITPEIRCWTAASTPEECRRWGTLERLLKGLRSSCATAERRLSFCRSASSSSRVRARSSSLHPTIVGHVVDGTCHVNPRVIRQRAERDVDWEFAAVFPQAEKVESAAHWPRVHVVGIHLPVCDVQAAKAFRHQRLNRAAEQLHPGVAEEPLRLAVDLDDDPAPIDDHDRVRRGFEEAVEEPLRPTGSGDRSSERRFNAGHNSTRLHVLHSGSRGRRCRDFIPRVRDVVASPPNETGCCRNASTQKLLLPTDHWPHCQQQPVSDRLRVHPGCLYRVVRQHGLHCFFGPPRRGRPTRFGERSLARSAPTRA